MASSRAKTRYLAEQSLYAFARRHPLFYFWTLTFADHVDDKDEANKRFKPLQDRLTRSGAEFHAFWERTKIGRWHLHFVTNTYLDVNELRPWLMARGWGQQMRVQRIEASPARFDGHTWRSDESCVKRVVLYLVKYCTKALVDESGQRKKVYSASQGAKCGTVKFQWVPWVNPTAYLFYWGKLQWFDLYGETPDFKIFHAVVRLGVEVTNWLEIDPWWMPSGP